VDALESPARPFEEVIHPFLSLSRTGAGEQIGLIARAFRVLLHVAAITPAAADVKPMCSSQGHHFMMLIAGPKGIA